MNKERIKILAAMLNGAGLPSKFKFNMDVLYQKTHDKTGAHCGSAGCIAGLTVHTFGDREKAEEYGWDVDTEAQKLLGLTSREAESLFYPVLPGFDIDCRKLKASQANKVLTHASKAGKIDWRKAGKFPASKE